MKIIKKMFVVSTFLLTAVSLMGNGHAAKDTANAQASSNVLYKSNDALAFVSNGPMEPLTSPNEIIRAKLYNMDGHTSGLILSVSSPFPDRPEISLWTVYEENGKQIMFKGYTNDNNDDNTPPLVEALNVKNLIQLSDGPHVVLSSIHRFYDIEIAKKQFTQVTELASSCNWIVTIVTTTTPDGQQIQVPMPVGCKLCKFIFGSDFPK